MYERAHLTSSHCSEQSSYWKEKWKGSKWEMLKSQRTTAGLWYGSGLAPEAFPWSPGMAGAEGYEDEMLEEDLCSSW